MRVSECVYGVLPTETPLIDSFAPGGSDVMSVVLEQPIMTNDTSSTLAMMRTKRVDIGTSGMYITEMSLRAQYSDRRRSTNDRHATNMITVLDTNGIQPRTAV